MARGPVEVQAACEAALVELSGAFATSGGERVTGGSGLGCSVRRSG